MANFGKLFVFIVLFNQGLARRRPPNRQDSALDRNTRREQRERETIDRISIHSRKPPSGMFLNNVCLNSSRCHSLSKDGHVSIFQQQEETSSNTAESCSISRINCNNIDPSFRTADGTCNNLAQPHFGSAFRPFLRLTQDTSYVDGVSEMVVNENPRTVSNLFTIPKPEKSKLTLMVMQFGQFLDHDLTHTPVESFFDSEDNPVAVDCCEDEAANNIEACAAIPMPSSESILKFKCMNFIRSAAAPSVQNDECTLGPRQQFNQITAYIDASNVYGSSEETQQSLRDNDGLLKTTLRNGFEYLPESSDACGDFKCFLAGDVRVNEQPQLANMHTIFVREHNKIARKIKQLQPSWTSDAIFKETRKIVAAEMQMIVYNEYLPAILGRAYVTGHDGLSLSSPTKYDPSVNPTIFNEFATAAFRFGHSQLPDTIPSSASATVPLSDTFFDTGLLNSVGNSVKEMTEGMTDKKANKVNRHFTPEVRNNLFKDDKVSFDLVALNIQRGRDHGLESYLTYRSVLLGKSSASEDIPNFDELIKIYKDEKKIDLFVGGVAEKNVNDAEVGPLFHKIISLQFANLKLGDRFFFDNNQGIYTPAAVREIKKVRLSHILCRNADLDGTIREYVMQSTGRALNCRSPTIANGIDVSVNGFFKGTSSPTPAPPRTRPPRTRPPPRRSRDGRQRGRRRR